MTRSPLMCCAIPLVTIVSCLTTAPGQTTQAAPITTEPALRAAVNVLPARGGTITLGVGTIDLHAPLDLRHDYVTLRGQGRTATILRARLPQSAADAPLIDMTGAAHGSIRDLRIDAPTPAGWALLLGRRTPEDSADGHLFENLEVDGKWTGGGVLNIGAEVGTWINCRLASDIGPAYVGDTRRRWPIAPLGELAGADGPVSHVTQTFIGCTFGVYNATSETEVPIVLGSGVRGYTFTGCCWSANAGQARAGMLLGSIDDPEYVEQLVIIGSQFETWGAEYAIEAVTRVKEPVIIGTMLGARRNALLWSRGAEGVIELANRVWLRP